MVVVAVVAVEVVVAVDLRLLRRREKLGQAGVVLGPLLARLGLPLLHAQGSNLPLSAESVACF